MKSLEAIIFDVDGTLINSIPYHNKSFIKLFSDFGLKLNKEQILSVMRLPTEEIYVKLKVKSLLGINLQPFLKIRRRYYYKLIKGKNLVFPHVYEILGKLKKIYKLAIATNSGLTTTRKQCPKKLLDLFDAVITFDDVKNGKPHPEMLEKVLKILKVKSSETVFVGDSVLDVIAANELSIKFIGVTTGTSSRKVLEENGAQFVLKNLSQLENYLRKFNGPVGI